MALNESVYDANAITISALLRLSDTIERNRDSMKNNTYGGRDFCGRRDQIFRRFRDACSDIWTDADRLMREVEKFAESAERPEKVAEPNGG